MPIDFKSLLNSLAQGDDAGVADTVLARRKNQPPVAQLLPGQQAVADIVQGASGASDSDGFTNQASLEQQGKSAPVFGQPTVQGPAVGQQAQPVVGSNIPDTPEHDMYVNAQQQGVQDQPSNVDNTATVSPSLFNTPFDDSVRTQQGKYDQAVQDPIVHQSFWKDLAAKAPKVAEAFVKGFRGDFNDIDPAYGWGRIKHDTAVRNEGTKLGQLEQQQQYSTQQGLQRANIANVQAQPEIKRQANALRQQQITNKYDQDQKTYARLVQNEKDRNTRAGNKTQTKEVDGYLYRTYPNDPSKGLEPIIDPKTGKQAYNPANVAQQITFPDGTTAWAKGGQIVSGKFAEGRQASQQTFEANTNKAKMDYGLAIKQYESANGRQKALEKAATTFKQKYYDTHGKNPSQAEIDAFVNGILPQEDEETP